jgi:hypothetical protein
MSSAVGGRASFQQFADLVCGRAEAKGWPALTYQAGFITVMHPGTDKRTIEGNSSCWNAEWDMDSDSTDHPVRVPSGEQAWRAFLTTALYPDLLRADAELQKQ